MEQLVKPRLNISVAAGQCHKYVREAYGAPPMCGSAWEAWQHAEHRHTGLPPNGVAVPLFFSHWGTYGNPPRYGNWGHVVIQHADGVLWSSPARGYGFKRLSSISEVERTFNCKYVGWSEDINRVRVVKPASKPAPVRRQEHDMLLAHYKDAAGPGIERWAFFGPNFWLEIEQQASAEKFKAQLGMTEKSFECTDESSWLKFKKAAGA